MAPIKSLRDVVGASVLLVETGLVKNGGGAGETLLLQGELREKWSFVAFISFAVRG